MTTPLRKLIRELLEDEIAEISTSTAAGPYQTPFAFAGHGPGAKAKRDQNATQAGYKLAEDDVQPAMGDDTADDTGASGPLTEGRYHAWRNDASMTEAQKIGRTIAEITRQMNEMHRVVNMASRLKTETATPHDRLWKRTAKHVEKMEAKLEAIKECLIELRR